VLENGIAHVDLPCSGLRSLWTGTLFLLAATWLENRQIGTRWFLVYGASLFLQVLSNIVRVLILVVVTQLQQPTLAQILHIPLGLLGFICACGLTWIMLQSVPKHKLQQSQPKKELKTQNLKAQFLLLIVVIALALIPQLRQPQQEPLSIASLHWPSGLISKRLELTETEQRFFDNASATSEKRRFVSGELSGSILLVSSNSWGGYHAPELCFVGSGLKVDTTERQWLTPNIKARWLSLQDGKLSATYWFQSPKQTTDDFLSRLWSQVTRQQKTWVMISVLFDSSKSPDSSEVRAFATTIHNFINHSLNGD
jgi:exosortase O